MRRKLLRPVRRRPVLWTMQTNYVLIGMNVNTNTFKTNTFGARQRTQMPKPIMTSK